MKAITIKNIDADLYRKFKAACVLKDIGMKAAILEFMARFPKEKSK